ncbi:tripartite tricarboxylate transporter TctB family protein, partial [Rhodococcus sp. T7]
MTTPGPVHSEARADHRRDDDVTTLLGMHTRAAWVIVSIYIGGTALAAAGTLDGVSSVFPIALAVIVNAASAIALIAVSGDPLPWRATTAITLAGPASCALVLAALPVPITSPLQTWPIGAATAVYTFMCVRGRTWPAWAGLLGIVTVCVVWSQVTGQGAIHGITMSAISAGPLLMGTFFAYTIRPSAKAIFQLREESTRQIADEAAAAARLSERDAQLNRLDTLARPMLERISTGTPLSTEEMLQCRLLEAHLRDTLRAPALA